MRISPCFAGLASMLLLVHLIGCTEADHQTQTGDQVQIQLPPLPSLDDMDPPVRQQFRERYGRLVKTVAEKSALPEDVAWTLGQMGRLYQAYHYLEQATICLRQAHELDPLSFEWPYLLGHVERKLGRMQSAQSDFEAARDLRPEEAGPWIALGEIALQSGQLSAARLNFERALDLQPGQAFAGLGLARTQIESGQWPDAIERLRQLLVRQPRAYQLHYAMADALKKSGRLGAAKAHLDQIPAAAADRVGLKSADPWMEAIPRLAISATALEKRGRQAMVLGQSKVAVKLFERAVSTAPDRAELQYSLAVAYSKLQLETKADAILDTILKSHPGFAPAYRLKGQLADRRNDSESTGMWFARAIECDPADPASHLLLAGFLLDQSRYDEAVIHFSVATSLSPKNLNNYLGWSLALFQSGQTQAAIEILDLGLKELPQAKPLIWLRARWQLSRGEIPDLLAMGPARSVLAIETRAMILATTGRHAEATRWQGIALKMVTDDAPHHKTMEKRLRLYSRDMTADTVWAAKEPLPWVGP